MTEPGLPLHERSAVALHAELRRGRLHPSEVAEHYLERIARLDDRLHAFARIDAARALRWAADRRLHLAPLAGLPGAEKDLVARRGVPTLAGSRLPAPVPAAASDPVVERLDAAGIVSLGRTASAEYGMTGYTEPANGPAVLNPWDPSLGPGGSSGGAAAAVAARLLPFAIGSDGGGSVRIPAAATGLVGLKPTRGLLPEPEGAHPARLSVPGVLARTAADAALLHGALADPGLQPADSPWLAATRRAARPRGLRIAQLWDSPWRHRHEIALDPEIAAAVDATAAALRGLGHRIERIGLHDDEGYPGAFEIVWASIAARIPAEGREALLSPFVRWLWRRGRSLPESAVTAALTALRQHGERTAAAFAEFDAVLSPTVALLPRPIGWFGTDPREDFARQCRYAPYTSLVNVAGLPAISLPVSASRAGLPIGAQLIGRPGDETGLLALAAQLEAELGWASRHAPDWD